MLGGLIEANLEQHPERRRDFDALAARVGLQATDIEEAVTLDFERGRLTVHSALLPGCAVTIRADSETVIALSNQDYRRILAALFGGRLRIDGMRHLGTLNRVTRVFSVK
jgi:SCP-2 sterol transfer family protein